MMRTATRPSTLARARTSACRLDALRESHVLAPHLDLQRADDVLRRRIHACDSGGYLRVPADQAIAWGVPASAGAIEPAALQRRVPQHRKSWQFTSAQAAAFADGGIAQVLFQMRHDGFR